MHPGSWVHHSHLQGELVAARFLDGTSVDASGTYESIGDYDETMEVGVISAGLLRVAMAEELEIPAQISVVCGSVWKLPLQEPDSFTPP
jgi:hypothetical protein